MSNSGIRLQDLILPLAAGGAAAFSRPAARGIAVGLGALGGVMQQRQEQQRIQAELARAQEQQQAKIESGQRLGALIKSWRSAPKESAAILGFQAPEFDDALLSVAEYQIGAGNPDAAAETIAKARKPPQQQSRRFKTMDELRAAMGQLQPGEEFSGELEGGGSYKFKPDAPKPQKAIERTVDLGNIIRYHFTDGTTKDEPKGVSPGSLVAGLSNAQQTRVASEASHFDSLPAVKNFQKVAEAKSFVEGMDPNTTNSADDQALIYALAKVLDPDSVVREGEYATVERYSQSWASKFGFNARRVFENTEFLTPQARANIKKTIAARYVPAEKLYRVARKGVASRIDKIGGPGYGEQVLIDYAGGLAGDPAQGQPSATSAPAQPSAPTATGPNGEKLVLKDGQWQPQ